MAHLPGSLPRAEALALLETALDSGIRHFDTAPLYGWGAAEPLLGELARRRRGEMVIITKAGIAPPDLAARLVGKLTRTSANPRFGQFAPEQVRASVEASLRALQTETIDGLLLHEITPAQMSDDLARLLENLKRAGKTRAIGLATSADNTAALMAAYPGLFEIVQLPSDATAPAGVQMITHSVLGPRLAQAAQQAGGDRDRVAEVLLRAAMARNPRGVTLFSSTRREAIRRNAALTAADEATSSRAAELLGEN